MKIIIIAAVAKNGVIGLSNGKIPWHIKEDFSHFKKQTLGSPIIMGRKTFESLGKPLKNRTNIVITRNSEFKADEEVIIFKNIAESLEYCKGQKSEKVFIIGGGEIYSQAMGLADELIISKVNLEPDGNVFFPEINESEWILESTDVREEFTICYYSKRK